eukprot:CAMPEP_0174385970 /NCGR_PEP_ID=MMETSP0811_2-20130205/126965_1 /TAXON_ID=73025 ORGANISM="Eutreptiella gymnastica-like, Strain CCMP1594" /NCGR_SAMPLE_ID=MMETSP0811_2 /ASSEMBLY_ACC=CAM_ASM_000667 /LENGTH=125 /DNA_ID=CAMNT_0015540485 /DNA_START=1263 /DNA_END=1637 /DNA_ORIENTATION=+
MAGGPKRLHYYVAYNHAATPNHASVPHQCLTCIHLASRGPTSTCGTCINSGAVLREMKVGCGAQSAYFENVKTSKIMEPNICPRLLSLFDGPPLPVGAANNTTAPQPFAAESSWLLPGLSTPGRW